MKQTLLCTLVLVLSLSAFVACDDEDEPVADAGTGGTGGSGGTGGTAGTGGSAGTGGTTATGGTGGTAGTGGTGGMDAAVDVTVDTAPRDMLGDATAAAWTADATMLPIGAIATFNCSALGAFDTVYGTDYYTADSSICTAGVHSSLITQAAGGEVTIQVVEGRSQYLGSTRNSVTTTNWGMYDKSFRFVGVEPHNDAGVNDAPRGLPIQWNVTGGHLLMGQQITYRCLPGTASTIYGTDIYTSDSSICSAAVHAGKTTLAGGNDFIVEWAPGQASYTGSMRNGVTSSNWMAYPESFRFP